MAPTAEARARYARELVEHTMRQFTAARETLENPSSAPKRKHPAAHAARDGPRGRLYTAASRATNASSRIVVPNLVPPQPSFSPFAHPPTPADAVTLRRYFPAPYIPSSFHQLYNIVACSRDNIRMPLMGQG
ncbi:hypothetical protein DFH06DRAFT_1132539 [Mycena polygramma]|nr:hypothetical protein DFH06DRAFT_1132539 [Mycena polygramma]